MGASERAKTTGRWLVTLSGWLFGVLVFILAAPSKVNSFFDEKDAAWHHLSVWFWNLDRYEGRWTNDADLRPDENLITDGTIPKDHGEVQLELVDAGTNEFRGTLETRRLEKGFAPWSQVYVSGYVSFGGFRGEVWDIIEGRHQTLGYFRLEPTDKFGGNSLRLTADRKFEWILPSETTLWRTNATMSNGKWGDQYLKILFDVVRKGKAASPVAH
jgi:hypothetical protein